MGGDKSQTQLPEITLDFLRANHTDIVTALVEEGRQEGSRSGAEQERARIKAVKDQLIPGHEELINTLMWDGKTTGEQAAVQILAADKVLREKARRSRRRCSGRCSTCRAPRFGRRDRKDRGRKPAH